MFLPFIAVALIALVTWFAHIHGAMIPVLNPEGPVAFGERWVIIVTVLLSAIVVLPVFFLLFYFGWKYRADSTHAPVHHQPDWDHDSPAVEFSWWLPPAIIVAILAVIMWRSTRALDPYKPLVSSVPAMEVDVIALDWKWLFIYPAQGIASVNVLEIPAGVPVHFYLTADAPMNSFWIPALGGQIMVMPGMQTELNLLADEPGSYSGSSANISGDGFSGMAFTAQAVSQTDFDAWAAAARASSTPLTQTAYAALAQPSEYNPAASYVLSDAGLFNSVMLKYMVPTTAPMQ